MAATLLTVAVLLLAVCCWTINRNLRDLRLMHREDFQALYDDHNDLRREVFDAPPAYVRWADDWRRQTRNRRP